MNMYNWNSEQEKGIFFMAYRQGKQAELTRSLIAFLQIIMTAIAGYAATEIKDMSKSINTLNIQIASLLTDVSNEKSEINRLDQRITDSEIRLRITRGR